MLTKKRTRNEPLSQRAASATASARSLHALHERDALPDIDTWAPPMLPATGAEGEEATQAQQLSGISAAGCFTHDELLRRREMDGSRVFISLSRTLLPLTTNTASLLHHVRPVVAALLDSLGGGGRPGPGVAAHSILCIVSVLGRDLREELLPHFDGLAGGLRGLLPDASPELAGEVYRALSFLFKYVGQALLSRDQADAFPSRFNGWVTSPQGLAARQHHLRDMAAGALSVLLRRDTPAGATSKVMGVLKGMSSVGGAARPPELKDGVARLLFEMLRGVKTGFHSTAERLLPQLLSSFKPGTLKQEQWEEKQHTLALRFELVCAAVRFAAAHTNAVAGGVVWTALCAAVEGAGASWTAAAKSSAAPSALEISGLSLYTAQVTFLVTTWVQFGAGRLVKPGDPTLARALRTLTGVCLREPKRARGGAPLPQRLPVQVFSTLSLLAAAWPKLAQVDRRPRGAHHHHHSSGDDEPAGGAADANPVGEALLDSVFRLMEEEEDGAPAPPPAGRLALAVTAAAACILPSCSAAPPGVEEQVGEGVSRLTQGTGAPRYTPVPGDDASSQLLRFASSLIAQHPSSSTAVLPHLLSLLLPLSHSPLPDKVASVWHVLNSVREGAGGQRLALLEGDGGSFALSASLTRCLVTFSKGALSPADASHLYEAVCAVSALPVVDVPATLSALVAVFTAGATASAADSGLMHVRAAALHHAVDLALEGGSALPPHLAAVLPSALDWVRGLAEREGASKFELAALIASLRAVAALCGAVVGTGGTLPACLSVASACAVTEWAQRLLCSEVHGLRLSTLLLLASFPSAPLLPPGTHISALPEGPRFVLDDVVSTAYIGAGRTSDAPVSSAGLRIVLAVEALPPTIEMERIKSATLLSLGPLLACRAMPPHHVYAVLHALLGAFYTRYAPLWTGLTNLLASTAAVAYPRTLWRVLGSQLHRVALGRPVALVHDEEAGGADADFTLTPASAHGKVHHMNAKDKSKARGERADARVVPFRVTALLCNVFSENPTAVAPPSAAAAVPRDGRLWHALRDGLVGADAVLPAHLARLVDDPDSPSSLAAACSSGTLHSDPDAAADPDTAHRTLFGVLTAAPGFAEGRSRLLVPLFLAFLRDDFFGAGSAFSDDPDGVELQLDGVVRGLVTRNREQREVKRKRGPGDGDAGQDVIDTLLGTLSSPPPPGRVGLGGAGPLSPASASARLVHHLSLFALFKSWSSSFGGDQLAHVLVRLLARTDNGVAEGALRVLSSMRLPHLMPYLSSANNLLSDATYRSEMTGFSLAPLARGVMDVEGGVRHIDPSHRQDLLPLLLRLLFGRILLRRAGNSGRETPAVRRATIFAYLAGLGEEECGFVVYLCMRPLLLPLVGAPPLPLQSYDLLPASASRVPPPTTPAAANALVAHLRRSFEVGTSAAPGIGLLSVSRAVGFCSLLEDVIQQLGQKLGRSLHLPLAGVVALLTASARRGEGEAAIAPPTLSGHASEIRGLCINRLTEMFASFPE